MKKESTAIEKKRQKIGAPIVKTKYDLDKNAQDVKKSFYVTSKELVSEDEIAEMPKEVQAAAEAVKAQNSKKKKFMNFLFFLVNIAVIAVILIVQMKEGTVGSPGDLSINWIYLAIAVAMSLTYILTRTFKIQTLIYKATGNNRFALAFKLAILGKYYDLITPFATGGQPFQIYYSNKYGIKGGESLSIVMSEYMFQQIGYVIIVMAVMVGTNIVSGGIPGIIDTYTSVGAVEAGLVSTLSIVGFIIASGLLFIILVVILNKKVGVAIVVGVLRLFCKIFRRDYDKLFRKVMRTVNTWQTTMRRYKKAPLVWIFNIICSLLSYLSYYSIPYFIYCAFMGWNAKVWIIIIVLSVIIDLASSSNPLPGGAGVSDFSFLAVFSAMFEVTQQFWALLFWKGLTYYIFIAIGILIIFYDYLIGNRRLAKNKAKWSTPKYNKIRVKNSLY